MMNGYDMTGATWMMAGGWILLALAIVVGAWLIARSMHIGRLAPATPLEILQGRFARGEINADEFEKARLTLR